MLQRPATLRLIILYKYAKGGLGLALALVVFIVAVRGSGAALADGVARSLRHLTHPWAQSIGQVAVRALQGHYLFAVAFALVLDGTFTMLEGWALRRGAWWGPWLVVISTAMLLPPEVIAVVRHASAARAVILVINVAIVFYLVRHASAKGGGARVRKKR